MPCPVNLFPRVVISVSGNIPYNRAISILRWIPRTLFPTAELNEVVERTINLQLGVLELCCLCLPPTDPELWRSVKTELCTGVPLTRPASELNGTVGHHFGVHWWTWVMWESPRYLVAMCCVLSIGSFSN